MSKYRLAVMDCETDPENGEDGTYLPFVIGFYNGSSYRYFWDNPKIPGSCIQKFIAHLKVLEGPHLIYAHNGGKFDYMFMLDHFEGNLSIQNGRIIKAFIGEHQFRDSWSIIPIALSKFKTEHRKKEFSNRD